MECFRCGVAFESKIKSKKYCSNHCRKANLSVEYRIRYKNGTSSKLDTCRKCKQCGDMFTAFVPNKIYCSIKCRQKYYAKSKRDNKGVVYKKKDKPCENCGFDDEYALHWHHLNPKLKKAGGIMILCANCHCTYHKLQNNRETTDLTSLDVINVLKERKRCR